MVQIQGLVHQGFVGFKGVSSFGVKGLHFPELGPKDLWSLGFCLRYDLEERGWGLKARAEVSEKQDNEKQP